jgi:hypothetical protein
MQLLPHSAYFSTLRTKEAPFFRNVGNDVPVTTVKTSNLAKKDEHRAHVARLVNAGHKRNDIKAERGGEEREEQDKRQVNSNINNKKVKKKSYPSNRP